MRNEHTYFYLSIARAFDAEEFLRNVRNLASRLPFRGFLLRRETAPLPRRFMTTSCISREFVCIFSRRTVFSLYTISSSQSPKPQYTVSIPISITPTSASLIAAGLFIAIHPLDKSIGPRATAPAPPLVLFFSLSLIFSFSPPISDFLSHSFTVLLSASFRETKFF